MIIYEIFFKKISDFLKSSHPYELKPISSSSMSFLILISFKPLLIRQNIFVHTIKKGNLNFCLNCTLKIDHLSLSVHNKSHTMTDPLYNMYDFQLSNNDSFKLRNDWFSKTRLFNQITNHEGLCLTGRFW